MIHSETLSEMPDEELFALYEERLGGELKPGMTRGEVMSMLAQLVSYVGE